MRVLAITKIFPNAAEPLSSPFNRQQFAALAQRCELEVLAAIPWFPGRALVSEVVRRVPRTDTIDGVAVRHPRVAYLPRVGGAANGPLYAASLAREVVRYRGRVDVVLGAWAFPDGWAAVQLARALGVPAVIKLHGSDMDVIAREPGPRRLLRGALPRAARVVAVSRSLARAAEELGVARARIDVVYNGVDTELFFPADRAAARAELGLPAETKLILFVGRLIPDKGFGELCAAFERLARARDDVTLALVGPGDAGAVAGLGARVVAPGPRPLPEVARWLAACDVLTLPSWHEGTPNVVLEALTAGRRVVATAVGGIPDLITEPALGELVPARDAGALEAALARAADFEYDPAVVAARGGRGSWAESAAALHASLAAATQETV